MFKIELKNRDFRKSLYFYIELKNRDFRKSLYFYINILVPKTIEIIWICAAHNFFIVL